VRRGEWEARCQARFERAGADALFAAEAAIACAAAEHQENGGDPDDAGAWTPPDEAADEEMSNWSDDGP
jgi:hypothetical protein